MKWGVRYGPEYVNRLYGMVRRNITGDLRFICFTDQAEGLVEGIEAHPLPEINMPEVLPKFSAWRKLSLWQAPLLDLEGDVLFLDLDVVVTGSLDRFFDYRPGEYCVIENWRQKGQGIGNTTTYRFTVGRDSYIYDLANEEPEKYFAMYPNEQTYISREIKTSSHFWPEGWCVSFKEDLLPPWPLRFFKPAPFPQNASLVGFPGKPDPDEAAAGKWPAPWYKKTYKYLRPVKWISDHWK